MIQEGPCQELPRGRSLWTPCPSCCSDRHWKREKGVIREVTVGVRIQLTKEPKEIPVEGIACNRSFLPPAGPCYPIQRFPILQALDRCNLWNEISIRSRIWTRKLHTVQHRANIHHYRRNVNSGGGHEESWRRLVTASEEDDTI